VCRGGRPGERGIEAQKAPYTAPDRFGPGFEPPLSRVCPGLGSRLWGYAVRAVRPPYARAHAPRASVGFVPSLPGSGILFGFFGTNPGSYPANRFVPPPRAL
jgi:hypothetical protein